MNTLKIALLEDNQVILKDRKNVLEENKLGQVVIWSTNSTDFLEKALKEKPDALMLDIDLGNDSMSGVEVAHKLKLPVLFVSAFNDKNLKEIESINIEFDFPVDHLSKPFSDEILIKKTTRFLKEVSEYLNSKFIYLDFKEVKRNKISIDTIVYIESDTGNSGMSNNKRIYFTDRKPETLTDFSFSQMEGFGFDRNLFITTHKSYRVNASKINCYNKSHAVEVNIINENGQKETKLVPVSENYQKSIRSLQK
jgi:DNA-binding LytR/AlgR family response regulator